MADLTLPPDDAGLEGRLASLGALPVASRPTIADLKGRAANERLDTEPVGVPAPDPVDLAPSAAPSPPDDRRSRRWWLVAAVVVVALTIAAAAFGAVRRDQSVAAGGGGLAGRSFTSVSITEGGAPKAMPTAGVAGQPVRVSIRFSDDGASLNATAGCNGLHSAYTVEDGRLVLANDGESTMMYCAPELQALDTWLLQFLSSSPTIGFAGDHLTLASGDTVIELVDDEVLDPDRSLVGPWWELDSIIDGQVVSSAAVGPMTDRPGFHIVEGPGGELTLEGRSVCPGVTAPVTVDGDRLIVGEGTFDQVFCPRPSDAAAADAEAFARLFGTEWTVTIDASRLTLMAGDHGLVFRTTDPATPVDTTPSTVAQTTPATMPGSSPPLTGLDAVEALVGTRWELVAVDDQDGLLALRNAPGDPPLPYLLFAGDSTEFTQVVIGTDRCGEIRGEFGFTDQEIELHDMVVTDGACPDAAATRTAAAMSEVLTGTPAVTVTPTDLVVEKGGMKLIFQGGGRLDATGADLELVGPQWTVMRAGDGSGELTVDRADTAVFAPREAGSSQLDLLGFAGCQQFTASARVDGDTFTEVEWADAAPDCTPRAEDSLLGSVLQPGAGYVITGSVLKIRSGDRWVELAGSDAATAGGPMPPPPPRE